MKKYKKGNHLIQKTVAGLKIIQGEHFKLKKEPKSREEKERKEELRHFVIVLGLMFLFVLIHSYFPLLLSPSAVFVYILIGIFAIGIKSSYARFHKENTDGRIYEKACKNLLLDNHYPKINLVEKWLYTGFRLEKSFFLEDSFIPIPCYQGISKNGATFNISQLVKDDSNEPDSVVKPFGLILSLKSEDFSVKNILIQSKSLKNLNKIPRNIRSVNLEKISPKFLSEFDVFSRDEEEAQQLLFSFFLQTLVDLSRYLKGSNKWTNELIWSFTKNEVSILILSKHPFLELPLSSDTLIEKRHITRFISGMDEALDIIERIDFQLSKIPIDLKKAFLEKKNKPALEKEKIDDSPYDHLIDNGGA